MSDSSGKGTDEVNYGDTNLAIYFDGSMSTQIRGSISGIKNFGDFVPELNGIIFAQDVWTTIVVEQKKERFN